MKTISIGRSNCDIIIQDEHISRKHAEISLVNGQYVYRDLSANGTTVNGRVYHNEKVVLAPGTPAYLANKIPLPWPQVLMLLPNSPLRPELGGYGNDGEIGAKNTSSGEDIGVGWGILSFLFPIVGFILYFVWKDNDNHKAKQAANIAWIRVIIGFAIGFFSVLLASL